MRFTAVIVTFCALFLLTFSPQSQSLSFGVSDAFAADKDANKNFEYFEMNPLMIPIIGTRGLSQQVSFVIAIEVPSGHLNDIAAIEPRLADAYIQDLYGVLGAGFGVVNGNVLNVQAIKERLTAVTQKVVGGRFETDVLLQVVQQRPL